MKGYLTQIHDFLPLVLPVLSAHIAKKANITENAWVIAVFITNNFKWVMNEVIFQDFISFRIKS